MVSIFLTYWHFSTDNFIKAQITLFYSLFNACKIINNPVTEYLFKPRGNDGWLLIVCGFAITPIWRVTLWKNIQST